MRYFVLVLLIFTASFSWSQNLEFEFRGQVENLDEGKREGGVTVSIIQGGSTVATTTTSSNGKYTLSSPVNYKSPFKVVFSKSGFVSKFVQFNLSKLNEEDIPASATFRPVEDLSMSIFKNRDNVDFSFLNTQSVATFDWNSSGQAVRLDQVESNRVSKQIFALLDKADKDKAEAEIKYNQAIAKADELYNSKSYEASLAKYEEALKYKPAEKYPADRIVELDALIQANKAQALEEAQKDEKYNNLITAADNLKGQGKLEEAVVKYQAALAEKDAQYPKDQIAALNKQIEDKKKEAENQAKYDAAIKSADAFLKQNSVRAARDKYVEASKLKPSEQYPKDKLAELDGKLAAEEARAAKQQKYDDAIAAADALFDQEKWNESKEKYKEALAIETASSYAKGRIEMIDAKLKEEQEAKAKLEKIKQLLAEGGASMVASKWEEAKGKYNEVLTLDAENAEAKEKLAIIEQKLEDAKNEALQEENFNKLVKEGDDASTAKKYEDALAKYGQALEIKSTPDVVAKVDAIKKIMADAASEAEKKAKYEAAVKEADALLANSKLDESIAKYREALTIDNTQTYPTEKITEIEKLKNEAAAKDKKKADYEAAIKEADHLFNQSSWDEAKAKYREAMSIDDSQSYPNERISEIDAKLAEAAEEVKLKKKYDDIVTAANKLFDESEWEKAKAKYREAISIDETQPLPAQKIAEIEKIQADAKAEAEKKAQYDATIKAADELFAKKSWNDAKAKYEEAIAIDASQSYPNTKIAEIDKLMGNEAAEAERKAKYEAAISVADQLFGESKLAEAKSKYNEAIAIDGTQAYPKDKIAAIDKLIAEQSAEAQKSEAYNSLISAADALFNQDKLEDAKLKYTEALAISSSEVYPIQRISEIDNKLAAKAKLKSLLAEGKSLFEQNKLEGALGKYQEVLAIESTNAEATSQIAAINAKLNALQNDAEKEANFQKLKTEGFALATSKEYESALSKLEQALAIKSDGEISSKISEIKAAMAAMNEKNSLEEKYNQLISDAEGKEATTDYTGAIKSYKEALTLKPNETYPQNKIKDLEALINDANAQKAIDEKYQAAMKKGDDLMSQKKYLEAIKEFNNALTIKPNEQEPVDKAAEAERLEKAKGTEVDEQYEKILSAAQTKIETSEYTKAEELINRAMSLRPADPRPQEMLNEIERLKKLDNEYNSLMKKGDELAVNKSYEDAKSAYASALSKKPSESLPVEKIAEMDRLISESTSENQKEQLYKDYMSKGNSEFSSKEYVMALSQYQNALSVKPNDATALNKIKEVQQILDDIANAKAENLELTNQFNALVKEADSKFAAEDYLNAKTKYQEAQSLMNNSYVETQIKECERLERAKGVAEREREYQKIIDAGDKYFALGDYEKSKEYFTRAKTVRNEDPYPKKKLAEIESLLHPVMVESGKLEDLGDPFENSIMDGQALLEKAEAERKLLKKTKIQRRHKAISDSESEMTLAKTQDNYDKTNEIYMAQQKVGADAGKSDLNRQATIDALRASELERQGIEIGNNNFELAENQTDQQTLNVIIEKSGLEYGEKHSVYEKNTDIMKDINLKEATETSERNAANYNSNLESDQTLTGVKIKVEENTIEGNKNREVNTEVLKKGNKELAEANYGAYNAELEKYISNKGKINEEVNFNSGIDEAAKKAHGEKVEGMKAIDKYASISEVEAHKGDLEQRQEAKKSIHTAYANAGDNNIKEVEKREENNNKLVDVNKTLQSQRAAEAIGQQEKHYDAMGELNKVTDKKPEKVKVANSLGEEYPEGVSEESFTQSDKDGLMKAIITRRIVVINGHADVYVRTQTLDGITYSKNGKPSLSHVWSSETQDPSLKRNY